MFRLMYLFALLIPVSANAITVSDEYTKLASAAGGMTVSDSNYGLVNSAVRDREAFLEDAPDAVMCW